MPAFSPARLPSKARIINLLLLLSVCLVAVLLLTAMAQFAVLLRVPPPGQGAGQGWPSWAWALVRLFVLFLRDSSSGSLVAASWLTPEWVNAISSVVYTVCTIVLIAVALFQDDIRRWRSSPKLEASIQTESPWSATLLDEYPLPNGSEGYALTYFLRFKVLNQGRAAAEQVELFVNSVKRWNLAKKAFEASHFEPMNLVWAYTHQPYERIPISTSKYCDLGHVLDPKMRDLFPGRYPPAYHDSRETLFCLSTVHPSRARSYLLRPGAYLIWITAAMGNGKNVQIYLKLTLTGKWVTQNSFYGEEVVAGDVITVELLKSPNREVFQNASPVGTMSAQAVTQTITHGIASKPSQGEIARLAYTLWQQRGCPKESAELDWMEAERQLNK